MGKILQDKEAFKINLLENKLDIEQIAKKQRYKGIDKDKLFKKIDALNIEESIDELLKAVEE